MAGRPDRRLPAKKLQRFLASVEKRIRISENESSSPDQKLTSEELVALVTSVTEIAKLLREVDRQSARDKARRYKDMFTGL